MSPDQDLGARPMRILRSIAVVGCHAAGEVSDVIVAGILPPRGATLFKMMQAMRRDHDDVRMLLLREPRGGSPRHLNLLVPAVDPVCQTGVIMMEATQYLPSSELDLICTATVLLETHMVAMSEPQTALSIEVPGGRVRAIAKCKGGTCEAVEIENVASFVHRLDVPLEVEGFGTIVVDVAYGGTFCALVDGTALGFEVTADEAADLAVMSDRIRKAAQAQVVVVHPLNPEIRDVTSVQIHRSLKGAGRVIRSACADVPGRAERSATCAGTSARMAALYSRGMMKQGEWMIHKSIRGSALRGRVLGETRVGTRPAIVSAVSGRAWITGFHQYLLNKGDPFPQGYVRDVTRALRGG